ncbi:hypothetical protein [Cellulomonas sp. NS3]|uniref:hypothetical protein n=1 Tax=Cellulomonas sp. NS3 TaxID=2973977 RepID=UPI0021626A11|nr:hypothetical protein [Cellulomonas sp. NS3]
MSEHVRATDDRAGDRPRRDPEHPPTDDELTARLTRALASRAAAAPDPALVAARLQAALADRRGAPEPTSLTEFRRRGGRVVVAGVVTSALAVAGAGAAAAADPYSDVARAVENVAQAVGIDWSAMPPGYTREQYDAFWGAGYTPEDVDALAALWSTGTTETKARAGQMLLDGLVPPVAEGTAPADGTAPSDGTAPAEGYAEPLDPSATEDDRARAAFWDAGYTLEDVEALNALWSSESLETKARAGRLLLDGEPVPVAPGGTGPGDG